MTVAAACVTMIAKNKIDHMIVRIDNFLKSMISIFQLMRIFGGRARRANESASARSRFSAHSCTDSAISGNSSLRAGEAEVCD